MRIRWTVDAARDLTQICDYIEERDGPGAARRVALTIYESINSLAQFPHRGRVGRKLGTRELVFAGLPFLAVYRVRADVIEIKPNPAWFAELALAPLTLPSPAY